jgi:hypothetical protein
MLTLTQQVLSHAGISVTMSLTCNRDSDDDDDGYD